MNCFDTFAFGETLIIPHILHLGQAASEQDTSMNAWTRFCYNPR